MAHDEPVPGDMPVNPSSSPGDHRPMVAEEVVARYVAETVRRIDGVDDLHGSALEEFSERVRVGVPTKGIAVREAGSGSIEVDVHVRVTWGVSIPALAARVQDEVARTVDSLLDLTVERVTLYVDEITHPSGE